MMQRIDFKNLPGFQLARERMGISVTAEDNFTLERTAFHNIDWSLSVHRLLSASERSRLTETARGVFYEGQRVVLYCRPRLRQVRKSKNAVVLKAHLAWCSSITTSSGTSTGQKRIYVTDASDDVINGELISLWQLGKKVRIEPCQKCLQKLNIQGFSKATADMRAAIVKNFSLEDYLRG